MKKSVRMLADIWRSPLGRTMLAVLILVLTISSLVFLGVFVTAYRSRLIGEYEKSSMQVNILLEASLKNAMLKRDIPGLRAIIAELAGEKDIAALSILNPEGEIRFSTDPAREGKPFTEQLDLRAASTMLATAGSGEAVVRAARPVLNEPRCQECHGAVETHPVNGILVVDYAAEGIKHEALRSAVLLAVAGGVVLFVSLTAIALFLQKRVLLPLRGVADAASRFAGGDLAFRLAPSGNDEVGQLGRSFDSMASDLGRTIKALKLKEEFLQQLIDAMPDGVRVIGADYRILMVNAAYGRQLGIPPDTAIGDVCYASSHRLDAPCSPTLVTCPLVELHGERHALKCRHRHVTKEGGEIFVEVSAARAQLDRDGEKADCVIEVIRDLAEQAQISHQYRLSEIGQFAAGIAHEIHNPLSSIHLALTAIQSEASSLSAADRIVGYIEAANREIDRCIGVTNRLLRISEPPSDEVSLVDITAVLEDVAALVEYQAGQARVKIVVDAQENPRVFASEADMATIALNIIQNAIHAMPGGGALTIHATRSGSRVRITFSDTGVGIAPQDMQRIFWPFWSHRADGSIGSGLGLSICRAAVQRMQGELWLESKLGQGTSVRLELQSADHPEEHA